MPVVLQVNFTPGPALAAQSQNDKLASAQAIAGLPGLHWKIWLQDDLSGTRGGVYLFDTRESAQNWADTLTTRLGEGGATKISIRCFDINEEASHVTSAPLRALLAAA